MSPEEKARATAAISFPDLIEHWSRDYFYKTGYAMTAGGVGLTWALGILPGVSDLRCVGGRLLGQRLLRYATEFSHHSEEFPSARQCPIYL